MSITITKNPWRNVLSLATPILWLLSFTTSFAASTYTTKQQVDFCKQQLGFPSVPAGSCLNPNNRLVNQDGVLIYLGYFKLAENVDAVFRCDEVNVSARTAADVEFIIHNRTTGQTCFYSQNNPTVNGVAGAPVSANFPSLTATNIAPTWHEGQGNPGFCSSCHITGGPYFVTSEFAAPMAYFGLLNNGHIMTQKSGALTYSIVNIDPVLRAGENDDETVSSNPQPLKDSLNQLGGCALCHLFTLDDIVPDSAADGLIAEGAMPPFDDISDYRWINVSSPAIGPSGVDSETFAAAKSANNTTVPNLLSNCAAPGVMEAHIVGSDNVFVTAQQSNLGLLPDRLSVFNVKDGLICLNSDQESGHTCQDYKIRYECTDLNGNKTWTSWYNMDSPNNDGDHEERSKDANVCTSPTGLTVTGIEASTTLSNGWSYNSYGPNDRLARFSPYGLTCNNADQPDGQCANYVVRYSSCGAAPQTQSSKTLTNVYATGKQLTAASSSLAKGQGHNNSWNTQQWNIAPIANTEYVRIYNQGANVYLTVTSTAESATVGTAASNTTTNEMWVIEPVPGASDFRLKNLFSGKYLTIGDPKSFPSTPDYLPIFSQSRNTSWTSQRWLIQ